MSQQLEIRWYYKKQRRFLTDTWGGQSICILNENISQSASPGTQNVPIREPWRWNCRSKALRKHQRGAEEMQGLHSVCLCTNASLLLPGCVCQVACSLSLPSQWNVYKHGSEGKNLPEDAHPTFLFWWLILFRVAQEWSHGWLWIWGMTYRWAKHTAECIQWASSGDGHKQSMVYKCIP